MKRIIFTILIISLFLVACLPQQEIVQDNEPVVEENINEVATEPEDVSEVEDSEEAVLQPIEVPEENVEVTSTIPLTSVKIGRVKDPVTRNNGLTIFKIINSKTFVVSSFNSTTVFRDGDLVNYEVTNKNKVLKVWLADEEEVTGFGRPASYTLNRTSEEDTEVDWTFYEENYNKGRIERFNDNHDGTYTGFIKDFKTFRERKFDGVTKRFYTGDIVFY